MGNKMPIISVIIPAYNSGPYLDEAVQSVIAQTFTDWECVVVDDGSTEDLSRVEKMDPRVRLICQPNRVTSPARNMGILKSKGESVALLDHDDLRRPGNPEKQVAAMAASPGAGICHTGFIAKRPPRPSTATERFAARTVRLGVPRSGKAIQRANILNTAGKLE